MGTVQEKEDRVLCETYAQDTLGTSTVTNTAVATFVNYVLLLVSTLVHLPTFVYQRVSASFALTVVVIRPTGGDIADIDTKDVQALLHGQRQRHI